MDSPINPLHNRSVMIDDRVAVARPVEWDQKSVTKDLRGVDGNIICPVVLESMCPHCCLTLRFSAALASVRCPHCDRGVDRNILADFPDMFTDPGVFDAPISVPTDEML